MAEKPAGEFDLIARFFAPLSKNAPGALGLTDDAAILDISGTPIVTTDMMIEGVHFLPDSDPAEVAQKLLRVNISDLAAMGAEPVSYTLALGLAKGNHEAWAEAFARGLERDQAAFGITLIGGDTVATPGPVTAAITAFGRAGSQGALKRSGAKVGDLVYVSGTIGDAVLGLMVLTGDLVGLDRDASNMLVSRHRVPDPRSQLGVRLSGVATACIDVSDGLVQDLGHIAAASNIFIEIEAEAIPVSSAASAVIAQDPAMRARTWTGGDDYELAFTVPSDRESDVADIARDLQLSLVQIGRVKAPMKDASRDVVVLDAGGEDVTPDVGGFSHF